MSHLIGLLLNLFAGLILWLFVNKLFDWLPTSASLHEKFAGVKREKYANNKILELTPLVFFAFFWLFAGNLLWILLTVIIEILNSPDLIIDEPVKSVDFHCPSFRQKPESINFNMFWIPDQVRHDASVPFYGTIMNRDAERYHLTEPWTY